MYAKYIKRILDFVLSLVALIVLSPVLLIVAILVRVKLGSPVVFKQQRPGKNEKIFTLYKFRTMTDKKDENGNLLPDSERLTKFGKFLRSTSLDELPELVNILKGDMAIVGPRPLLVEYLPLYNEEQKHRHDVRPGLTGLAQVSGRNSITWEEKFNDDLEYIEKISILEDIKIIFTTIGKVFKREGISQENNATMEKFKGNKMEKKI
ncbi:MAG: sugar transferase [Clostridia bacterium]